MPPIPGDRSHKQKVERILRVDQAGELGAVRIYQGQMAVLGRKGDPALIRRMAAQEQTHLDTFNRMIGERQARPTVLSPLWHVAGFALGAATALLGEKAAMACTVAVEEAIEEHYARQAEDLADTEPELRRTILDFREDEMEHRHIGLEHGAEQAPGYPLLSAAIKGGCRLAIWLSERV